MSQFPYTRSEWNYEYKPACNDDAGPAGQHIHVTAHSDPGESAQIIEKDVQ